MDANGAIKVGDFGFSEDIYTSSYYRQKKSDTDVKLPVRWMAPESITVGVFTEKSDIVSAVKHYQYGVKLMLCGIQYVLLYYTSILSAVVIWSHMLGGVHWWTDPLQWNQSSSTTSAPPQW